MAVEKEEIKKDNEKGVSLLEYALLVALISVVSVVAMRVLGQKVSSQFSGVASQL